MATKKKQQSPEAETLEASQRKIDHSTRAVLVLSDDAITVIRELVQLALLTQTNIVDRLRTFVMEVGPGGKLVPSDAYIEAYNTMVSELEAAAKSLADEPDDESDPG
jgi:hypothetical protein